jgi:hypothetical protein
MRMKVRKNLLLSVQAVRRGATLAAKHGTSLSAIVEKELLSAAADEEPADYWPHPTKPIVRKDDPRFEYLRKKHG